MGQRTRNRLRWLQAAIFFTVITLISACATVPTPQHSDAAEFVRSGRFAMNMHYPDNKHDAVQGGFSWVETKQQIQLDLSNPMGSVLARIVVDAKGAATLYRTDGSTEHAPTPDALIEQVLGNPIPVSKLRDWIRGSIADTARDVELVEAKPVAFYDDGWRVRLQRYDEKGPRLLWLNRNNNQGDMTVRLVIDH